MENFNYYVRKIFRLKLSIFVMLSILIAGSLFWDIKLFLDYRNLKSRYSSLEEINIKNKEEEEIVKELEGFKDAYKLLNKQLLEKQLNDTGDLKYDRFSISEKGNIIGFNLKNPSEIKKYTKNLNEKGYKVNIISMEKHQGEVYFEMEVK